jgi:hypothetical protein
MNVLHENKKWDMNPYIEYMGIGATVFMQYLLGLKEN